MNKHGRIGMKLKDGLVFVGSDAHYWPGKPTTAHRGFVSLIHETKPDIVIMNGDVIDGSAISRHSPIGWEDFPDVQEELEVAKQRLEEIEDASGSADLIWNLGNHDARFETRLASVAAQYKGVHGVHLKDHFPAWVPAWSVEIGGLDAGILVTHRYLGGKHAAYNNVVNSGRSMLTGHLHRLSVRAVTLDGRPRWGVEGGMLGDPRGRQFTGYTEDSPVDWQAGFVILTFKDGKLLPPEPVYVTGPKEITWRGERLYV